MNDYRKYTSESLLSPVEISDSASHSGGGGDKGGGSGKGGVKGGGTVIRQPEPPIGR